MTREEQARAHADTIRTKLRELNTVVAKAAQDGVKTEFGVRVITERESLPVIVLNDIWIEEKL